MTRMPQTTPVVEWISHYPAAQLAPDRALEKLAKDIHANRYDCTTLLGAHEYQLMSVEAPAVPRDELKTAIRWRLKDMLDFHVDDATIDVLDIPVDKNAPVRNHLMYAVAARNQLIEQRQTMFSRSKVPLRVIDIPDLAQRNFSGLLEPDGRGIAMLSFDLEGGLFTVTFAGELYLSRRIDVTLAHLVQAKDQEKTSLFEKITLELQRSLDHFDRQFHFITLSKLFLAPLAGPNAELKEYLASNLYLPVELFDLEAILDVSKVPDLKEIEVQQCFFLTLGAALRVEERVL